MSLLSLFILVIATAKHAHGQNCTDTWVWTTPTGGSATTLSVGAPATFVAAVEDVLEDTDVVEWKIGTTVQSTDTYNGTSFASTNVEEGITTSYAAQTGGATGNVYTMNIAQDTLTIANHNGKSVTVESKTCESGGVSPAVVLTVQYCNLTYFGAEGVAENDAVCGYNCTRNFACASGDKNFTATCQEDATWSPTTAPCGDAIRQGGVVALVILSTLVSMTQFF